MSRRGGRRRSFRGFGGRFVAAVGGGIGAPVNSVLPVASGDVLLGHTLSATSGSWSGSPSYTYQWRRDGSDIVGATSATYVVTMADLGPFIDVVVTATNGAGSASADSNDLVAAALAAALGSYQGFRNFAGAFPWRHAALRQGAHGSSAWPAIVAAEFFG